MEIIEFLLEIFGFLLDLASLLEMLIQLIVELFIELGFESFGRARKKPARTRKPVLTFVGLILLGALLGLASAYVFPKLLLPPARWPGLSLILAPLGAGSVMWAFGKWRKLRGGDPTYLATFWGGAVFAFAMALVRKLMLG